MVQTQQFCDKHGEHYFGYCSKCPQPTITTTSTARTVSIPPPGAGEPVEEGECPDCEIGYVRHAAKEIQDFLTGQLSAANAKIESLQRERDDLKMIIQQYADKVDSLSAIETEASVFRNLIQELADGAWHISEGLTGEAQKILRIHPSPIKQDDNG